jgi:phage-related protein
MSSTDKPLVWLRGRVISPPFTKNGRRKVGELLRRLQGGHSLRMPLSRPMPSVGARCHELRIVDEVVTWRLIYRTDADAIVIGAVFFKQTETTPRAVIEACKRRFKEYDNA